MPHGPFCSEKCTRFNNGVRTPCLLGAGPKPARIMIVSECPGQKEDALGTPFGGASERTVNELLAAVGIDRSQVYVTNAVKCGTPIENVAPTKKEIKICKQYLVGEINEVKPEIIVTLGAKALEAVLNRTGIATINNNVFMSEEFNVRVLPIYHPAFGLRNPGVLPAIKRGFELLASELRGQAKPVDKTSFFIAKNEEDVNKILSKLERVSQFAFDFETSGLDYRTCKIISAAFTWSVGSAAVIPWPLHTEKTLSRLSKIFATDNISKIAHNVKFEMNVCKANGMPLAYPIEDTMLMHHLLDENSKHGLDTLTLRYTNMGEYWKDLDEYKDKYCKDHSLSKDDFSYDKIPPEILYPYNGRDTDATLRSFLMFKTRLENQKLTKIYYEYVLPFTAIIAEMEYRGIAVDREKLADLIVEYTKKKEELEISVYADPAVVAYEQLRKDQVKEELRKKFDESKILKSRYGDFEAYAVNALKEKEYKFNMSSPKQLGELFFTLPKRAPIKTTDKGGISVDEEVLEALDKLGVSAAKVMLEYRRLLKYLSTYLVSTYEKSAKDGRIHGEFLQHGTVTGRLCVAGDTLVETNKGLVRIDSINIGDKVLTHRGRYRKVLGKYYKGKEEMYKVILSTGKNIQCTLAHKFLTPNGWRSLHEALCYFPRDICDKTFYRRDALYHNFIRGQFQEGYVGRAVDRHTSKKEIQYTNKNVEYNAKSLSKKIQAGLSQSKKLSSCTSAYGEYSLFKRCPRYYFRQERASCMLNEKNAVGTDSKNFWNKRMVYTEKYSISQFEVCRKRRKTSNAFVQCGFSIFKKIGVFFPRDIGKSSAVLYKSASIFSGPIRSIYSCERDSLVYSRSKKDSWLLCREAENTERSYLLEYQPRRTSVIDRVIKCRNSAYEAGLFEKRRKILYSRFLFPGNKFSRGGRWIFSQKEQRNKEERQGERNFNSGIRVSPFEIYRYLGVEESRPSTVKYTREFVSEIIPVGVQDVWDIQVEEDHSYVAQGFINHNSSRNPNLQNLPRDAKDFKKCLVADPGYTFVKADLAQAEFRCWATYAEDEDMIADIHSGLDIHKRTASEVFGVPVSDIKKDDPRRTAAKNCTFGLMYGRGSAAIASQYNISQEQAEEIKATFFSRYPKARDWLFRQKKFVRVHGYVSSALGRYRRLPEISSDDKGVVAEAERQATNSPIQSLASDCNNHYMTMTIKRARATGIDCYPVASVHDANFILVKDDQVSVLIEIMRDVVKTEFPEFKCKMALDIELGKNFGEFVPAK